MTTLYLTEPRSLVKKDGDTLLVQIPADKVRNTEKRKVRIPLMKVTHVVVYGDVTLTSPAMTSLLERGVDIAFCSYYGHYRGQLTSPFSKNSLIRLAQHQAYHDPVKAFSLARAFVRGKLANMRVMLLRANRKRNLTTLTEAAASLKQLLEQLDGLEAAAATLPEDATKPQADTLYGKLLGIEGAGSARYFGVFASLLNVDWGFNKRQKRPPRDPVNALLSFGYVLLSQQVASAVSLVGLDPFVGFLHRAHYGKPALALDVMEPFRPLIVDSVVLTVLNNGMLSRQDFTEELGAWRLSEQGRRTFLSKFEERLNTEMRHPVFDYRASYRRCLELEVRLVSKWLSGEIPQYESLVVR